MLYQDVYYQEHRVCMSENWRIVRCPECGYMKADIASISGDVITFRCQKCEHKWEDILKRKAHDKKQPTRKARGTSPQRKAKTEPEETEQPTVLEPSQLVVQLPDLPDNVGSIIQDGVLHSTAAIFQHAAFARKRLDNLTVAINYLESRILSPEGLAKMDDEKLVGFYQLYHKLSLQLIEKLEDSYSLAADDAKFTQLKELLEKNITPANASDAKEDRQIKDNRKNAMYMVQKLLTQRSKKNGHVSD